MNYADRIRRQQAAINYLVPNEFDSPLGDSPILQGYVASLSKLRAEAEASRTAWPWPEDLKQAHDAFIKTHDNFNRYLEDLLLGGDRDNSDGEFDAAKAHALLHAIGAFSKIYDSYFIDDDSVTLTAYGNKLQRLLRLAKGRVNDFETQGELGLTSLKR